MYSGISVFNCCFIQVLFDNYTTLFLKLGIVRHLYSAVVSVGQSVITVLNRCFGRVLCDY